MLRNHFIKKNISTNDIEYVIGHNGSIYLKITLKTILLLFLIFGVFLLLQKYVDFNSLQRLFGGIWVVILGKYIIDFLNLYLDGLAFSRDGITLFMWEGLLQYKTEYFDREKIVTINHEQNGIWDKIFHRWDLLINLEQGIEFPFEAITAPKKQVDKIMRLKERFTNQNYSNSQSDTIQPNNDKMKAFMEAFWEVMKEFMDTKDEDNLSA